MPSRRAAPTEPEPTAERTLRSGRVYGNTDTHAPVRRATRLRPTFVEPAIIARDEAVVASVHTTRATSRRSLLDDSSETASTTPSLNDGTSDQEFDEIQPLAENTPTFSQVRLYDQIPPNLRQIILCFTNDKSRATLCCSCLSMALIFSALFHYHVIYVNPHGVTLQPSTSIFQQLTVILGALCCYLAIFHQVARTYLGLVDVAASLLEAHIPGGRFPMIRLILQAPVRGAVEPVLILLTAYFIGCAYHWVGHTEAGLATSMFLGFLLLWCTKVLLDGIERLLLNHGIRIPLFPIVLLTSFVLLYDFSGLSTCSTGIYWTTSWVYRQLATAAKIATIVTTRARATATVTVTVTTTTTSEIRDLTKAGSLSTATALIAMSGQGLIATCLAFVPISDDHNLQSPRQFAQDSNSPVMFNCESVKDQDWTKQWIQSLTNIEVDMTPRGTIEAFQRQHPDQHMDEEFTNEIHYKPGTQTASLSDTVHRNAARAMGSTDIAESNAAMSTQSEPNMEASPAQDGSTTKTLDAPESVHGATDHSQPSVTKPPSSYPFYDEDDFSDEAIMYRLKQEYMDKIFAPPASEGAGTILTHRFTGRDGTLTDLVNKMLMWTTINEADGDTHSLVYYTPASTIIATWSESTLQNKWDPFVWLVWGLQWANQGAVTTRAGCEDEIYSIKRSQASAAAAASATKDVGEPMLTMTADD